MLGEVLEERMLHPHPQSSAIEIHTDTPLEIRSSIYGNLALQGVSKYSTEEHVFFSPFPGKLFR